MMKNEDILMVMFFFKSDKILLWEKSAMLWSVWSVYQLQSNGPFKCWVVAKVQKIPQNIKHCLWVRGFHCQHLSREK